MPNNTTKKKNVKAIIEDRILEMMMESNVPVWKQPWLFHGYDKAFNGSGYKGVNTFVTAAARLAYGFESHVWLTETKINDLNGRVWDDKTRKFKKTKHSDKFYYKKAGYTKRAVPVAFYTQLEEKDPVTKLPVIDENGNVKTFPFLRYFFVYNASDIAGLEDSLCDLEPATRVLSVDESKSALELENELLALYPNPPKVVHNADKASYCPENDTIYMPPVSTFESKEEYFCSFAHELAHSTGHKDRLNRIACSEKDLDEFDRAKEELLAEIFATLACATFGIEHIVINNAVAYCKEWYNIIKAHTGMLFDAIASADKAYDLIFKDKLEEVATEKGKATEKALLAV